MCAAEQRLHHPAEAARPMHSIGEVYISCSYQALKKCELGIAMCASGNTIPPRFSGNLVAAAQAVEASEYPGCPSARKQEGQSDEGPCKCGGHAAVGQTKAFMLYGDAHFSVQCLLDVPSAAQGIESIRIPRMPFSKKNKKGNRTRALASVEVMRQWAKTQAVMLYGGQHHSIMQLIGSTPSQSLTRT